jgi:hypothetical protein
VWIQKFERTTGGEVGGDLLAEGFGGCAERGFVEDLSDLFAVGADDHRVQVPDVVDEVTVSAEGELAAAAEGVEDGALGLGGVLGGGAVEGADDGVDGGVALRVRRG